MYWNIRLTTDSNLIKKKYRETGVSLAQKVIN